MNILIVGVNGFLGNAIATQAVSAGHQVFGLSRTPQYRLARNVTHITCDRNNANEVTEIISRHKIDVLVDVIAMTLASTQPLLDCVDAKIHQYVLISSSDVYRNYELLQKKATGKPTTKSVDEDSELRQTRFPYRGQTPRQKDSADRHLDDYDKIPIECAARQLASKWTILRLPMVFGPGDKGARFRWVIKPMSNGASELVVPSNWLSWHSTYGYVQNVAEAVALTLGNRRAHNRVFNVGEQPSITHLDWAKRFADVIGWQGEIKPTIDPQHPFAQRVAELDLSVPFMIDSSRIRKELGFTEQIDQLQALKNTVASELQ